MFRHEKEIDPFNYYTRSLCGFNFFRWKYNSALAKGKCVVSNDESRNSSHHGRKRQAKNDEK